MKSAVVIVGIGQLGGVFAKGFLRCGRAVFPILRGTDMNDLARKLPEPELVWITVRKEELHAVLWAVPDTWQNRLGLLQNELLPSDWLAHDLPHPTVCIVRFEKRKGQAARAEVPSYVYGPKADLILCAYEKLGFPIEALESPEEIMLELVRKNLFILTTNIAGLVAGGTLEGLLADHKDLTLQIANEVLDLQETLVDERLPRERLVEHMFDLFRRVPDQSTTGRSAPDRLARALQQARTQGLDLPRLEQIQREL
jgi:hypothetical protein